MENSIAWYKYLMLKNMIGFSAAINCKSALASGEWEALAEQRTDSQCEDDG